MTPKPDFLSKSSLKLLKYFFQKGTIIPPETHQLSQSCINQLLDSGFINSSVYSIDISSMFTEYSYTITEDGKGYLRYLKNESRKKWIPYIITTTISVLALMKSYGYGIDDIILWCMQQLTR